MSNTAAQLNLFPVGKTVGVDSEGRVKGSLEITKMDRLREVARLVTQGYKPGEVARALGITQAMGSKLINEARSLGLIDFLNEARNKTIMEMKERRSDLARKGYEVLQKRLNFVQKKSSSELDARDVKDAFAALDITEHTIKENKVSPTPTKVVVQNAIFAPEDLKRAERVSDRILGESKFTQ